MVIGGGCAVFTGVCSLGLWHETKESFFLYTGFLPFLFSCYMFFKGLSLMKNDKGNEYQPHRELSQEIKQNLYRKNKPQTDERAEKTDENPEFFNEP